MGYSACDRYEIRIRDGRFLRVEDLAAAKIDGYWDMSREQWFDVQTFLQQGGSR